MASNQYDFDYEDDDNTDYTGSDLVKQLRQQIKELSKENKQLTESLYEVQSYVKEAVVSSVLEERGLNPAIADFIPDEYADDEDSINEWLQHYGHLFGAAVGESGEDEGTYDQSVAQAVNRMSEFESSTIDPEMGLDLAHKIESAQSQEELLRILKGAQ
jgi:hypothetical protein